MATKEQIELLEGYLREASPMAFFRTLDENQTGMNAILCLLFESEKTLSAGMISEAMNISTARVAVLLRKMVNKGLITKEAYALDARVTVVQLTEFGESIARKRQEEFYRQINDVIDEVGMEQMLEFVRISQKIKSIVREPGFDL